MNPAAIATAPPPSSSSWSGTSTPVAPNSRDGTASRPLAISSGRRPSAPTTSAKLSRVRVPGSGSPAAITPSTSESARTLPKIHSVPTLSASAPSGGPSSAPAIPMPKSVPITVPRLSPLSASITQVSAPAQVMAPATPWVKRAPSSSAAESARPKVRLEAPISASPTSTVVRGPIRAAMKPEGSEAIRVPAG